MCQLHLIQGHGGGGNETDNASQGATLPKSLEEILEWSDKTIFQPLQTISRTTIRLIPVQSAQKVVPDGAHSFCDRLKGNCHTCAICSRIHRDLRARATKSREIETTVCSFGFVLFSYVLTTGNETLGFLEGGMVFSWQADLKAFEKLTLEFFPDAAPSEIVTMREEYVSTPIVSGLELDNVFKFVKFIAGTLTTEIKNHHLPKQSLEPAAIQKARQYIEDHLMEKLTVSTVAVAAGVSESHFSKLFKRITGQSCGTYIICQRIALAQKMLLTTSKSISEIAYECGFESISHFNRSFKTLTKNPPKLYRKTNAPGVALIQ